MAFELDQVVHMKEGNGETSYAKCSYIQKHVLLLTKSIREEAIRKFYTKNRPPTLSIADLGCSSSELNSQSVVFELMETCRKLGHDTTPQDYQVYLNDLPRSDFNTVFNSLPSFQKNLRQKLGDDFGHCFVNGVPGSFYGRLFPNSSLHFVHSSYSLHWLSQTPEGIGDESKRDICITRTSPPSVIKAYYDQFQRDFSMFLRCRSKEVIQGGCMVLTFMGRDTIEPFSKKSCYTCELLAMALNDMVVEGHIAEEKLNSFNVPYYFPSGVELGFLIEKEGSFALNQVHVSEVHLKGGNNYDNNGSHFSTFDHQDYSKCVRSVTEPLLIAHFGDEIIDELFERFTEIVRVAQAKEDIVLTNVTVSMTKMG